MLLVICSTLSIRAQYIVQSNILWAHKVTCLQIYYANIYMYMYNNYLWLDLVEPSPVNLVSPYTGVVIRSVTVAWLVVSSHFPKHTQKYLSFLLDKFICRSFLESLDELHRHVVHNILFLEC